MASRPLIKETLQILHLGGFNPCKSDTFSKFRAVVVTGMVVYLWLEVWLFCLYKWKGFESLDALTTFAGICELLVKFYNITSQQNNLRKVLKKIDKFWPINQFGPEEENEIESIVRLFKKIGKLMCLFVCIILPAYVAKPFYGKVRIMPIHTYHPVDLYKFPNFEIAYCYQITVLVIGSIFNVALDWLFLSLIITIICQLKLLKEGIRKIPIYTTIKSESNIRLSEISQLVDQHNLILDCIKDIAQIYSIFLLQKYLTSMFSISTGLLGIISSGIPPRMDALYKDGIFASIYTVQLFFYCAAGSSLTEESASVSEVVYNTQWYVKTQPKLRRAYVMIIQRANKIEELSAGGMFSLNLDSFSKVIRAVLSFFTLVETLYTDA